LEKVHRHISRLRGNVKAQADQIEKKRQAGLSATSIEDELARRQKARVRLATSWSLGDIDDRTYQDSLTDLDKVEGRLSEMLASLKVTAAAPEPAEIAALAEQLLTLWPEMDGAQKNRALSDVLSGFVLFPSKYHNQPVRDRLWVVWR
jgi:site-specific DNA recombinase